MASQVRAVSGKVVAVTGAARGIGRATAAALAAQGARVAIGDLDLELARSAAAELGDGCVALELDVTDPASFTAFLDAVERELGPIDVLVNNAGILHLGPFLEEADDATARQIDVNVGGVINGMKTALPRLRERPEGHLVNVASSAGKVSPAGIATYAATKHAVVGLTEAVRSEHRDSSVEFSIVMPGVVRTEMIQGYLETRGVTSIGPEEVAEAIVAAVRSPRLDVYVPRTLRPLLALMEVLPRRGSDLLVRLLRVDQVTWEADRSARAGYEARAAASGSGAGRSNEARPERR